MELSLLRGVGFSEHLDILKKQGYELLFKLKSNRIPTLPVFLTKHWAILRRTTKSAALINT